ncbi:MAG: FliH/SctL family protein [Clostridium sp.]|nr:FliH/SctL family protein [Clostridium sp.]
MTRSLYRNLYKAGWFVMDGDARLIDSNERMKAVIKEAAAERASYGEGDLENAEEFTAGLQAAEIDALLDPDSEGVLLKNISKQEQEEIYRQLEEAKAELEQTRMEAGRLLADAENQIESMRMSALREAEAQGYQEGHERGMAEVQAMKNELNAKMAQLEAEYQQQVEMLEPDFVEVLTDIYENIFKVDLSSYEGIVTNLVTNAMLKAGNASNYIVHVSKEDYPQVMKQKDRILEGTGTLPERLEIISDMTLAVSQCMIETENGIYDCSLGTELEELGRKLKILSYSKQ